MFDEMSKKHSFRCSTTSIAKRPRFNPEVVSAKTQTRLQLQQRLTESHQALLSAAVDIIESPHAHDVLSRASNQEKNVCLFTYLGAEGFDCLRTATQLVPPSFKERRASYIARTVNWVCPRIINDELITAVLPQCNGPFFDRHACFDAYLPELRTISESSGKAHTAYIAPPVTYCLNTSCPRRGELYSLVIHHSEVDAVVWDVEGPIPATKVSLKCKHCATIYNYSKYGNKTTGGERFYEQERPLIEVSDVTFCSRKLYSLYCSLW